MSHCSHAPGRADHVGRVAVEQAAERAAVEVPAGLVEVLGAGAVDLRRARAVDVAPARRPRGSCGCCRSMMCPRMVWLTPTNLPRPVVSRNTQSRPGVVLPAFERGPEVAGGAVGDRARTPSGCRGRSPRRRPPRSPGPSRCRAAPWRGCGTASATTRSRSRPRPSHREEQRLHLGLAEARSRRTRRAARRRCARRRRRYARACSAGSRRTAPRGRSPPPAPPRSARR